MGSFRFGSPVAWVVDGLAAIFGDPISDAAWEYPNEREGVWFDPFGDFSFGFPVGRQTCFSNEFCVEAGGPTIDELEFTGWTQSEASNSLTTTLGIGIGSVWAENTEVMTVDDGGCLSFGTGSSGGIDLQLQSSGDLFAGPDGSGGFILGEPDSADVTVVGLFAGALRTFVYGDC